MIVSFADSETEAFFNDGTCPDEWTTFKRVAARKLDMLAAANRLQDLASPPNNRLEKLKGDRKGQHSIRVNDQYRVCFRWKDDGAHDVEIVDYH